MRRLSSSSSISSDKLAGLKAASAILLASALSCSGVKTIKPYDLTNSTKSSGRALAAFSSVMPVSLSSGSSKRVGVSTQPSSSFASSSSSVSENISPLGDSWLNRNTGRFGFITFSMIGTFYKSY
ncbi:hypothetical protein BA3_0012 [Thalassomonas phage BA3]|uniref:hypothetical protein n=1 Tax=Thalassomonas phage BA3 TaxID=469660 RepID=UPI00015D9591|nr:hypothetical protein BA3_0012 [Thalassomonas phage BA3]ABV74297.1 hypothetical protein BA3_0012 [Thalassomonas phage BA3]